MAENFSYFDQYFDVEIDLTEYLNIMTKTSSASNYRYNLSNIQPVKTLVKDLFTKFNISADFKKNMDLVMQYTVQENETIEIVSYQQYETVDYWWVVAIFNDIKNPFKDWPLNQEQLNKAVDLLYDNEGKYSHRTYFELLFENNEKRRNLVLPRPTAINDIVWAYREAILASTP